MYCLELLKAKFTLEHSIKIQKGEVEVGIYLYPFFNPLNPELNPICHLLALLAHHFLHVSRIRVKS